MNWNWKFRAVWMLCLGVNDMNREMKDSRVEWLGEIPKDWKVTKIKHKFKIVAGATPKSEQKENFDGNIIWITPADYKTTDKYVFVGKRNLSNIGYESCNTTIVPAGSIIFSKRAPIGSVAIAQTELCTNQGCLSCVKKENVDQRYFYFLMGILTEEFKLLGTGTTFKEISAFSFANFRMPCPSIGEQVRIATFLEKKCGKIENIIQNSKASIEEYKKLKQAIIIRGVTKGIRNVRPMKESGIEWIGEIPVSWNLVPFRHVLKERIEKNNPIKSTERLSLSIDLGVTLYSEKTTNLDRFKDDFEQYKVAHKGDLVMNSMNMLVGASGQSDYFGCVSPAYYTFYDETEGHCTAKYCEYVFRSKAMLRILFSLGKGIYAIVRGDDRVNTCRLKVSKEDLKNIVIPVPPLEEQREIVKYLNEKCGEINGIIAKKEQFISEMENYKKSLIYEYVTGKKEVPEI